MAVYRDYGKHRRQFKLNKKKVLLTQSICALCGMPVDKALKFPHPLSPTIDHIIPIDKGGHPSDIANLQLAHFTCNRQKSNRVGVVVSKKNETKSNRDLPHLIDWFSYKG